MNSLSLKNFTSKSIDVKSFAVVKACRRIKTERKEHLITLSQPQISVQKDNLVPIATHQKSFQSIFSKRKRSNYSGYKQCNLNKCKYIQFQEETQQTKHTPHRNYETHIKNIAKLRKKYSLEPQIKITLVEEKIPEISSPLKIRMEAECQIAMSERKHHKNLRELMKNIFERQKMAQKTDHNEPVESEATRVSTNRTHDQNFHRYDEEPQQELYHLRDTTQKNEKKNKKCSPSFWKRNKKLDYQIGCRYFNSLKKTRYEKGRFPTEAEENKLCGWQSQVQLY